MSDEKPPQEPSMEEIIASISRAIGEDGGARAPAPATAATDDILELTEAIDENGRVRRIEPAGPAASPLTPAQTDPKLPEPLPRLGVAPPGPERLISAATAKASATAFGRLGEPAPSGQSGGEFPIGGVGRTLEDIVHDALAPLLRSWLDAHLPAIVERLVREEIARVARDAGRR